MAGQVQYAQQTDDEQRPVLIRQEIDGFKTEHRQNRVDDAVVFKQRFPQHRDGHRAAQNGRHIVRRSEQTHALDFEIEDVGDEQRENQLERNGHKRVSEGHLQRLDVLRLGKRVDVVLETDDILHALEQIVIREAVYQRGHERIELKDAEADQPRQDQDKAHVALLQLAQPAPPSEVLARGGRSIRHGISPFPS